MEIRRGMSVLYLAGTPMWAHIYGVRNGMRALGIDVITVGTPTGANPFYQAIMDALRRYDPDFAYDLVCEPDEKIDQLLSRLNRRPDLILYMENGAAFLPQGLAWVPIPTIGVLTEDFSHADWEPDLFPYFDVALTSYHESLETYSARGHDNLKYWYLGGVDAYHRDFGLPRTYDVCLIGGLSTLHRERAKIIGRVLRLREEGINVLTGYGAYFEEYSRLYSQSKIVLNRSASDTQINMRVLEAAACGALVITNRLRNDRDPSARFLTEGRHVVYYDSDAEAVQLIRHYLSHDEERQAVATAGREFVLAHHTYAHVARDLFERIVSGIGSDFYERRRGRLARWGIDPLREALDYGKYFYLHHCPGISDRYYQEAEREHPQSVATVGLGLSAALRGDLPGARQMLRRATREVGSSAELVLARVNTAAVLFHHRSKLSPSEALAACTVALETLDRSDDVPPPLRDWLYFPPSYDRFRMELSAAFWKISSIGERWQRLRNLLRYQLCRFMGALALESGDPEEAIRFFSEALSVLPDDGQTLYELARACLSREDREAALRNLQKALEEEPFNEDAQRLLASLQQEAAKREFKPGISAIVHTLNEEAKVEDALKSLQGWVDEIIVCDMKSDDRTVEIAKRYATKIIFHDRIRDFDAARNVSAAHAEHEWVFYLDADERVTPELASRLRQLIDGRAVEFDALRIPMDDRWIGQRIAAWERKWPMYKSPQLLRNGRFHFLGQVHAGPVVDGKVVSLNSDDKSLAIVHYAWDGIRHWMAKINNYTDSEAEKLDAAGKRFHWREAVRAFVEGCSVDCHPVGPKDALEFLVSFLGANYRFYQWAKLHERRFLAGTLTSEENEAPAGIVEVFEYALDVAREITGRGRVEPAGEKKPATPPKRQKFSLYHTEGREDDLKAWMTPYADLFRGCGKVLDVGCGPGLFLELLRERGIEGHGVDSDPEMVEVCRSKGFSASASDAKTLASQEREWDGIHLGHIVEHMDGDAAISLLEQCAKALRPGGLLLIRTPNWMNEQVRNGGFWLDHTHVRPYPLELLERILLDLGLEVAHKGYEPGGWQDTYIVGERLPSSVARHDVLPEITSVDDRIGIVWEGSFFVHHSLSTINMEVTRHLIELGVDVGLVPYEPAQFAPNADARYASLAGSLGRRPGKVRIHVRHRFPPDFTPVPEGRLVLIQPWEFGPVPVEWVRGIGASVKEVWVPSEYVKECYVGSGVPPEKLVVIPNGIDPQRFHPAAPPLSLSTAKRFRFLFVGGTIPRKGYDLLLRAYMEEFTGADDTCLVIKDQAYYRQQREAELNELRSRPNAPEILYLHDDLLPSQLPGLYRAAHCYVHPFRGEGFGMPIVEAMACGLPVIVTDYGPTRDYCSPETAYLIPAREVRSPERKIDHLETAGYPTWAEPDLQVLRRWMRHVYEHPEEARAKGLRASERARSQLTWRRMAERILERCLALSETTHGRSQSRNGSGGVALHEDRGEETNMEERDEKFGGNGHGRSPAELVEAGRKQFTEGKIQEAAEAFKTALHFDTSNAAVWNDLACVHAAKGDLREAERCLRKSEILSNGEDGAVASRNLGALYFQQQRWMDAIASYEVALAKTFDLDTLVALSDCYLKMGAAESSILGFRKALELAPDHQEAQAGLAAAERLALRR